MPERDRAEYMRLRRAKLAGKTTVVESPKIEETRITRPTEPDETKATGATIPKSKFKTGYHYLPGDHAIGAMTQKQRDAVLERINKPTKS